MNLLPQNPKLIYCFKSLPLKYVQRSGVVHYIMLESNSIIFLVKDASTLDTLLPTNGCPTIPKIPFRTLDS